MSRNFRQANETNGDMSWSSKNEEFGGEVDSSLHHQSKRYRSLHNSAARKKIEAKKRRDLFDDDYDNYN